jgi:hypothetical protein
MGRLISACCLAFSFTLKMEVICSSETVGLSALHTIMVQNTVLFLVMTIRTKSNTVFTLNRGVMQFHFCFRIT